MQTMKLWSRAKGGLRSESSCITKADIFGEGGWEEGLTPRGPGLFQGTPTACPCTRTWQIFKCRGYPGAQASDRGHMLSPHSYTTMHAGEES